jgi:hypothetical protein
MSPVLEWALRHMLHAVVVWQDRACLSLPVSLLTSCIDKLPWYVVLSNSAFGVCAL